MSEEDAAAPLKAFQEAEKAASVKVSQCRQSLAQREKEQKGNEENLKIVKELQERVSKAHKEIVEKKKLTEVHEKKALGTKLLAELKEQVSGLDAEVKKATEAAAPLLEQGGIDFLVGTSLRTLSTALNAHMKEKELDVAGLFKAAGGEKMKEDAFTKYLKGLPEAIARDELNAFSDERRSAIFKKVSANGKEVTQEDFKGMLEPGQTVDLTGAQKEAAGDLTRSECTFDGKSGWVTIRQLKGSVFLMASKPFTHFTQAVDK